MKGKWTGSYTVEAAWIMSFVLLAILAVMQAAFQLKDETVGELSLQTEVEIARHAEENLQENTIEKSAGGRGWSLQIRSPVFRPEDWMRLLSLMEEKHNDYSIPEGNES